MDAPDKRKRFYFAAASRSYINLDNILYVDCKNMAELRLVLVGSVEIFVSGNHDVENLLRLLDGIPEGQLAD